MTILKQILTIFAISCLPAVARGQMLTVVPTNGPNPLVWDATEKHKDLPGMTNVTYFTFFVTNNGTASATIYSNVTSCDCSVAQTIAQLPWEIKPGEGGALNVLINVRGEYGVISRTVLVYGSFGTQLLTMDMEIPISPAPFNVSSRITDRMASEKNRQAVFGEHCEVCHSWPAHGRTGEALFQAVCGVCHLSEHRAEMVPDLAALKMRTTADFWRTNIISGKSGSLMPAFAIAEGGILDTNQVESLVAYLVKKYPSKN